MLSMANSDGKVLLGSYGNGNVPLGFRFRPTDQELVSFFLKRRIVDRKSIMSFYCNNYLHEFDPFGKIEPWLVWEKFGGPSLCDHDVYLFYELHSLSLKRNRRGIDAGGTWRETSSKPVKDLNGKKVGDKRKFTYENQGCENDGEWLLEEYSILPSEVDCAAAAATPKVVLCRLKKNPRSVNKGNHSISNSTSPQDQLNEKPPAIANKRKRARAKNEDQLNEKPPATANKRKRGRKGLGLQNQIPDRAIAIEELRSCCPSTSTCPLVLPLPVDGSNSEMMYHDQELMSYTNYDGIMWNDSSVNDIVNIPMNDGGGDTEYDFGDDLVTVEELLGATEPPLPQEELLLLPQIAENQVPLPICAAALGCGDALMESWSSSNLYNMMCNKPIEDTAYWTNSLWMDEPIDHGSHLAAY